MKNSKPATLVLALFVASLWNHASAQNEPSSAPPPDASPWETPLHKQATADAWAAFRIGDNEKAITNADLCIARYRAAADRSQATLDADGIALPEGNISQAEKKRTAQYQILHDVATCFLIKGWAEEKLGNKIEARKAYTEAKKYTLARTSTGKSVWSPAKKASDSLLKLR